MNVLVKEEEYFLKSINQENKRIQIQLAKETPDETKRIKILNDGLSDTRKKLFSAWHTEFAKNGILSTSPDNSECFPIIFEDYPIHEPEIIRIPDELSISPRLLEDSEDDDIISQAELELGLSYDECERAGILDLRQVGIKTLQRSFNLRCACLGSKYLYNLIRCIKCKAWQHLDCMMAMYSDLDLKDCVKLPTKNPRIIKDLSEYNNHIKENPAKHKIIDMSKNPLSTITPNKYQCENCGKYPVNISVLKSVKSLYITNDSDINLFNSAITYEKTPSIKSNNKNSFDQSIIAKVAASSVQKSLANFDAQSRIKQDHVKAVRADKIRQETTDINQRVPSPPRKSKRKQVLNSNQLIINTVKEEIHSPKRPYDTSCKVYKKEEEPLAALPMIKKPTPQTPLKSASNNDFNFCRAFQNTYSDKLLNTLGYLVDQNDKTYPSKFFRSVNHNVFSINPLTNGLRTTTALSPGDLVLEVIGNMMLFSEFDDRNNFYSKPAPFAFVYGNLAQSIVVDTKTYGNDSRFIRRSCNPNCTLTHAFIKGKLHIFIKTMMDINASVEMTLPFDLDYTLLDYPLDCGCERKRCNVVKWNRRLPKYTYPKLSLLPTEINALSEPIMKQPIQFSKYSSKNTISGELQDLYSTKNPSDKENALY